MVAFDKTMIRFIEDLILASHLGSYNGSRLNTPQWTRGLMSIA